MSRLLKNIALSSVFLVLVLLSLYFVTGIVYWENPRNTSFPGAIVIGGSSFNFGGNTSFWSGTDGQMYNITNFTVLINSTVICSARNTTAQQKFFSCVGDTNILSYNADSIAFDTNINLTFIFRNGTYSDPAVQTIIDNRNLTIKVDNLKPQVGDYLSDAPEDNACRNTNSIFIGVDNANDTYFNRTVIYLYNSTWINSSTIYLRGVDQNQNKTLDMSADFGVIDGIYYFNVTVYDNATNYNSTTRRTFYLDRTAPSSAIITVPSSDVIFTTSDTVSCSSSDATSGVNDTVITIKGPGSDTTVRKTIRATSGTFETGSGKEIGTMGTYTVECTVKDRAGNEAAASSQTFVVRLASGTSSGTGAGTIRTYNMGTLKTGESKTQLIKQNDKATFIIGTTTHIATVTNVGTDSATIKIESDLVTLTLNVEETKKIDFEVDNVYDLAVKLVSVIGTQAKLEFKAITESYTGAAVPYEGYEGAEELEEEEAPEEEAQITPTKSLAALWWTIGIIAIIVIIALIISATKKKK